jgi:hypothetical protein
VTANGVATILPHSRANLAVLVALRGAVRDGIEHSYSNLVKIARDADPDGALANRDLGRLIDIVALGSFRR